MSKRDLSINPRILACAKEQFLLYGFEKTSLKSICQEAGVTTGAFYKRFSSKLELFEAIVDSTVRDIEQVKTQLIQRDYKQLNDNKLVEIWEMSEETHREWMNFFYDRYHGIRLLLFCSNQTSYEGFLDNFIQSNVIEWLQFVDEVKRRGLTVNSIDGDTLYIFAKIYWTAFFEPIMQEFSREKALDYCKTLTTFFNWEAVFGFNQSLN